MLKKIAFALCLASATPVALAARAPVPAEAPVTKADVLQALTARRMNNLTAFRAYRKAGVYPHNTVRRGPLNVWRDREGHLCAAATMLDKDGKHDLVMATAKSNNFIRLLDVTDGELMDWILTSGFTIEEIDHIQEPMMMNDEPDIDYKLADADLAHGYAVTDAWLVRRKEVALETAVKRLMEHPALARQLVSH